MSFNVTFHATGKVWCPLNGLILESQQHILQINVYTRGVQQSISGCDFHLPLDISKALTVDHEHFYLSIKNIQNNNTSMMTKSFLST